MKTYTMIRPGKVLVEEDGAESYIITPAMIREMLTSVRQERTAIVQKITELEAELAAVLAALNG